MDNNIQIIQNFLLANPDIIYHLETSIKVIGDEIRDKRLLFRFYFNENPHIDMKNKIFELCFDYFNLDQKQCTNFINTYISNLYLFGFDDELVKMYFINETDNLTFTQLKCTLPQYEILHYSYGQSNPEIFGNLGFYFYQTPLIRNDNDRYFKVNDEYNLGTSVLLHLLKTNNRSVKRTVRFKMAFLMRNNAKPMWINYSDNKYCVYFNIDSLNTFMEMKNL